MRLSVVLIALLASVRALAVTPAAGAAAPAAAAAAAPAPPGAEAFLGCKKYPGDKKFKWSVRGEVGVAELASSLGEISCRPIVVASAIATRGGKVVLEVPDLVTAADVYRLFYGALEVMGLTIDASGGALKIVDAARAREVATPELTPDGVTAADDRFVVRLMRPKHAAPSEMAELLGKLKSKDGDVSVFGAASLVLIDRAVNVRRMEELARALDIGAAGARIYTLTVHGQTATEVAGVIEKILTAASPRGPGAAAAPVDNRGRGASAAAAASGGAIDGDVRALVPLDNVRLVAIVGNDAGWQRVQAIAARVDPPAEEGAAARGHVVQLSHTNAEDLAATLSSVGLGSRSGGGGGARPPGAPGAPSPTPSAGAPLSLSGEVRIGADKTANALIVYANAADFAAVSDLIRQLDTPRRQVYVEAVIFDLSVDKQRNIGVSWHSGSNAGSGNTAFAAGGTGASLLTADSTSLANTIAAASSGGLFAGVMGQSFSFMGQSIPSFGVVLQALEKSKDANVISRPQLLTMDNTKASLSVGQNIVFQTQSLASAVTAGSIASTFQRQTVALTLELTPHLNESSSIRLEIDGTIEDVADGTNASPGGPTTNQRKLKTAVVVNDGQCVVLGGLTKESDIQTVEKIPFLGDIPLLGRLFQTKAKQRVKQDLLIVLMPFIIRGPEDLRRIHERREADRREFLERFSAFNDSNFEAHVDYKRTRGLLAEINASAGAAEVEAEALRAAERQLRPRRTDGPIALEPAAENP